MDICAYHFGVGSQAINNPVMNLTKLVSVLEPKQARLPVLVYSLQQLPSQVQPLERHHPQAWLHSRHLLQKPAWHCRSHPCTNPRLQTGTTAP